MTTKENISATDPGLPRLGWGAALAVLFLQFWVRYLPSPWAVFVADDWANWARSSFFQTYAEALRIGLQDPHRPLSMAAVNLGFQLLGNHAIYWTTISLVANSLLLLFIMKMALELTASRFTAILTGIIFALLPNLTETYHWSTQVLNEVSCALVPYALSGWLWVAYFRRGGAWRFVLSVIAFAIALFSYEAGILLPGAYLVLLPWRKTRTKSVLLIAPIAAVVLFYFLWRATNAFGLNHTWHYPPHMEGSLSLRGVIYNAWQVLHWWLGDHLFGAIRNGLDSFSTIPLWTRRFLFLANGIVVFLVGRGLRALSNRSVVTTEAKTFNPVQITGFTLIWAGAAMAMSLVSYTAGRLNVLPAIGLSLLFAFIFTALPIRKWAPILFLPAFLAILANQGTAESFRQAGALHQNLFDKMTETKDEWATKQFLLIDTHTLRERLTTGLLQPVGTSEATWATYGNALLIRGFVPNGMAKLITHESEPAITILHDVEYGASIEGDQLIWHDRYSPARTHTNSTKDLFAIECLPDSQSRARKAQ